MKTYISLLRGINVSGQNKIRMPDLKRIYESINLEKVGIYIQSGNVVFDCQEQDQVILARNIETGIFQTLGITVRVLLHDKQYFFRIKGNNPFLIHRNENPGKLHVTFLSDIPEKSLLNNLLSYEENRRLDKGSVDEFAIIGSEIYLFCPNGYGKTRFSNTFFERKLNVSATTRNWKTVNALCEILEER